VIELITCVRQIYLILSLTSTKHGKASNSADIGALLNYVKQLRRQTRERRQYIYAKSLEAQERQTYERKRQLKDALASGKPLPTELRKDAKDLGRDLGFDEAQAGESERSQRMLQSLVLKFCIAW
jgi:hypothetical protein